MNTPQDTGLICSGCKGTIWSNEPIHTDDLMCKNGWPTNWHRLCKCTNERDVLAVRQAATELEKSKAMVSLRRLQDPAMPDTLPEAVDYLIDHSNAGWTRASELLVAVKDMTRRMAATERELERWRHGETIEGDFICPNALRADAAERERDELQRQAKLTIRRAFTDDGMEKDKYDSVAEMQVALLKRERDELGKRLADLTKNK